ncbi:N-methyl-L-tryptophan oxidase [Streptomyces sp. NBC_00199]|uniref:N-methyl-L-tryptophan oxidase n=1 Tax=Streptomyces sp. NBC_00199 TaxID=2975678 RepID=UPI002257A567|nr:N-methyl-L-tryptophan oxidase [Streptomyces sp. NBC_00199]MCX5264685.1 N-methyl-L-tryptophan oxidase [Streptomyces sp. NBC_00199]
MSRSYDVIVLGLGGMGSSAAYHLARRGERVLGLERFGPAHALGASHGGSRIYRQGYAEGAAYVPLLLRAQELWDRLATESGREVFTPTGGLVIGPQDSPMVAGSVRSAEVWGLEHEVLDSADIRRRFPTFSPADDEVAFYERGAGVVRPELTVRAHLDLAAASGAELRFEEPASRWEIDAHGGARVVTSRGTYVADRLVIAPGAWAPRLLADIGVPVRVERRVMYWFAPRGGTAPFTPDRHPVYVWEDRTGTDIYGFPALDGPDGGAKVAFHDRGAAADPDQLDREIHPQEVEAMRAYLRPRIPALAGPFLKGAACTYSLTPDEHFVLSTHPAHPQVTVACGFSGHGFKFVPVVGEIIADLVLTGTTAHPVELFDARRGRAASD